MEGLVVITILNGSPSFSSADSDWYLCHNLHQFCSILQFLNKYKAASVEGIHLTNGLKLQMSATPQYDNKNN